MFTKIPPITLLQIFCDFMIYSQVIFKSIKDPDDTFQGDVQAWMSYAPFYLFYSDLSWWQFTNNKPQIFLIVINAMNDMSWRIKILLHMCEIWNLKKAPNIESCTVIINDITAISFYKHLWSNS